MPESPPPPIGTSGPTPDANQPHELQALLQQLQAEQAGTRRAMLLSTLIILAIVGLFGVGLYRSASQNLTAEQIQPVLQARAADYAPKLQAKAIEAAQLALPTYQQLAMDKAKQITPQFREQLTLTMQTLPVRLEKRLTERMEQLQQRVEQSAGKQVRERFDYIDDAQVERLADAVSDELLASGQRLQNNLEDRLGEQLTRFQQVMLQFDVPNTDASTEDELMFKLLENVGLLVVHLSRNPDELPAFSHVDTEGALR